MHKDNDNEDEKAGFIDLTVETDLQKNIASTLSNKTPRVFLTQLGATPSNTGKNVAVLPQNIVIMPSSMVTSQNVVTTSQNTIVTPLTHYIEESTANIIKIAMDIAQVEPTPQTLIKIGNEIFQSVSQVQKQQVIKQHISQQQPVEESIMPTESFTIPEGFRKHKFENTLEKIDPVHEKDQKAGKRFFCQLCMMNKIETGYTKRFDLTKHLTRCGKEGVEKPFKCTGYGACEKSFARVENL